MIDQWGLYIELGGYPNRCLQLDDFKSLNVDVESTNIVNYEAFPHITWWECWFHKVLSPTMLESHSTHDAQVDKFTTPTLW